jgi:hypothetical protein
MTRLLAATVMAVASGFALQAQEPSPGTWELRPVRGGSGYRLQLRDEQQSHGTRVDLGRLTGLTQAQVGMAGPVRFTLRRDAGTLAFEGVARAGVAAGTYTLELNPGFASELARRGVEKPSIAQHREMVRQDVTLAFVDELRRSSPVTLAGLIRAGEHGIDVDYLRGLRSMGYDRLALEQLVRLRQHGVDAGYVRDLGWLGYRRPPIEDLVRLRQHGVEPQYVRAMASLGYGPLTIEQLMTLRRHGIDPDYVRELNALGYARLTIEELQRLRSHGIEPDYIRSLQGLGYARVSIDELAALRAHGIDPRDVSRENARAGRRLPVGQLTAMATRRWRP